MSGVRDCPHPFYQAPGDRGVVHLHHADTIGGTSVTEAHICTITDSLILLQYLEMCGEMRRGFTLLKMRGSKHDKDIYEFTIDGSEKDVSKPFRNIVGIWSGNPVHVASGEIERMSGLLQEAASGQTDCDATQD
jgi:hypothetical protein